MPAEGADDEQRSSDPHNPGRHSEKDKADRPLQRLNGNRKYL